MASAKTNCPRCGLKGSLIFSEWTENGAPMGAGYWPMEMSDVQQECEYELTDEEEEAAHEKAWTFVQDEHDADALAQAEELDAAEVEWQQLEADTASREFDTDR